MLDHRERQREREALGVVYYMAAYPAPGAAPAVVKIGAAVDLSRRIPRWRRQHPHLNVGVIATEPGHELLEGQRHREFEAYRLTGDWFLISGALAEHIEGLAR